MKARLEVQPGARETQRLVLYYKREGEELVRHTYATYEKDTTAIARALHALADWIDKQG